jgi:hypothetical protein
MATRRTRRTKLLQAKAVAGGKNVGVMAGVDIGQRYIRA